MPLNTKIQIQRVVLPEHSTEDPTQRCALNRLRRPEDDKVISMGDPGKKNLDHVSQWTLNEMNDSPSTEQFSIRV